MTSASPDPLNFISPVSATSYTAGQLTELLLDCQSKQVTGIARIEVLSMDGISLHFLMLNNGSIVYAGRAIPSPYEFVIELARYLHIGALDSVLSFAAKRSSIQSVVQAMVEIGVLQWSEVAKVIRNKVRKVLEELLPTTGRISFESSPAAFDLRYGDGEEGLLVDSLLLEREIRNREKNPDALAKETVVGPAILSLDDSPIAQALVQRVLGRDYTILACSHAFAALKILNSRQDISMLLLDLTLPDINGLDFCRALRKIERYKGLPIVMMTARDGLVDRIRSQFAGTTHYLTKPIDPEALKFIVAQYIA